MTVHERWIVATAAWSLVAVVAVASPQLVYLAWPITFPCILIALVHGARAWRRARTHEAPLVRVTAVRVLVAASLAWAIAGALAVHVVGSGSLGTAAMIGWAATALAAARALHVTSPRRLAALALVQLVAWPLLVAVRGQLPHYTHPGNAIADAWAIRLTLAAAIAGSALALGAGAIAELASSGSTLPRGIVRARR